MDFTFSMETLKGLQPYLIQYGLKALSALLIFIIGKWIARRITNVFVKVLQVRDIDQTLVKFLEGIFYYLLLAAVIISAIGQLGVKTTSFLAIIGAAGLAVGLALKDSLANFSSGVMLILFRPFRVGDLVIVGGEEGVVEKISIFSTMLNTVDNQKKIIPNGAIGNAPITNQTANPTRRVDLVIGIGYDDDIKKAKDILVDIVESQEKVLKSPAPVVAVSELADSSVNLVVRPWVNTPDYWSVYFALTERIKITFDAQGITIPYPQRDVHLIQEES